jgi:hypothetical protein
LASVFPSLHESSTEHVGGHVLVHLTTIAISKDCDVNLVKSGWRSTTRRKSSPAGHCGLLVGEGGSLGWQADGLDGREAVKVHSRFQLKDRDVV